LEPEKPDEQLMLAFARGDALAFEILVRRHRAPVFNYILRFTGDRFRAEDVLQETWLKVVRGAGEYQVTARFTTWLYTVARNLCVDRARKDKRRSTEPLDAPRLERGADRHAPALADTLADPGAGPDLAAHHARLRPLLEQALLSLPEEQREVFLLREYRGIAFKEIAVVTGVSENTAKSRMRYALEGLRRTLEALGLDGETAVDERTVAG
jgi:RNA polymerase sigma-70 factor (ECF subfamily)